jgi:hypothetical protein
MPKKFTYSNFPELQVRTLDHVSAQIGHARERHEGLAVVYISRSWT